MSFSRKSGEDPAAIGKAGGASPAGEGSRTTGAGERPVLLLLAGLLCDETVWHGVAAHLADIVDVRFFSFPDHRSIPAMAEQVLAHAPGRFALAGHSMGGRVALELFRQAPQRVDRLALLNTGVRPLKDGETAGRAELVELARSAGLAALADAWLPPMMSERGRADRELMERLRAMILRATAESFAGQVEALLRRPDAGCVLPMIRVPLLLLSGSEDRWSPFSQHADMQAVALHGQLVEVAGAGHMAPAEQPAAVAAALRTWMAEPGL